MPFNPCPRSLPTRFSSKAILALAILLFGGFPCLAQYKFEIQPFAGYKYGGGVNVGLNPYGVDRINIDSSVTYGVTATFNPAERLGVEFLWERQPTYAHATYNGGGTYGNKVGFNMDQYHGDILFSLADHGSKVEPFVLVGFGASNMNGGGAGASTTKFSFGVGGGLKYFLTTHLGLRVQARYTPTYAYTTSGGIWCNWWGYCWSVPNDHFLNQGDVTGGIVIRF